LVYYPTKNPYRATNHGLTPSILRSGIDQQHQITINIKPRIRARLC